MIGLKILSVLLMLSMQFILYLALAAVDKRRRNERSGYCAIVYMMCVLSFIILGVILGWL